MFFFYPLAFLGRPLLLFCCLFSLSVLSATYTVLPFSRHCLLDCTKQQASFLGNFFHVSGLVNHVIPDSNQNDQVSVINLLAGFLGVFFGAFTFSGQYVLFKVFIYVLFLGSSSFSSMVSSIITSSVGSSVGFSASAAGCSTEVSGTGSASTVLVASVFSIFISCF